MPVSLWESEVGGVYENKGIAQIERDGKTWMLSVLCKGTHSTYLDDTKIDLTLYEKKYVNVRYRYVDRAVPVQCIQAPCPPMIERRIVLEKITLTSIGDSEAKKVAENCLGSGSGSTRRKN